MVDIIGYMNELGVKIHHRYGDELICSCPFKENHYNGDRHPSFGINLVTGLWNCFACGEKGNMVQLAQKLLKIPFMEARAIAIKYGEEQDPLKIIENLNANQKEIQTNIYYETDKWCKDESIDYWESRGLNLETQRKYRLGFDEVEDRAVVPHFVKGECLGWQKRNINGGFPKWQSSQNLPKSNTLFGADFIDGEIAFIVEAPVSSIWLMQLGYPAVATFGAGINYKQTVEIRKKFNCVIIWFDPDDAGEKGKQSLINELWGFVELYVVDNIEGDPNDLSKERIEEIMAQNIRKVEFFEKK